MFERPKLAAEPWQDGALLPLIHFSHHMLLVYLYSPFFRWPAILGMTTCDAALLHCGPALRFLHFRLEMSFMSYQDRESIKY